MRTRVVGLETEFAASATRRRVPWRLAEALSLMFAAACEAGFVDRDVKGAPRQWLLNGGRGYKDTGDHPEYATPECTSILQLIASDRAGELLFDSFARAACAHLEDASLVLYKNNVDATGHSWGSHENYLTGRDVELSHLMAAAAPFLATRALLCGAGHVRKSAGATNFEISQRSPHMRELSSASTTTTRSMFHMKDDPEADKARWRRIHLILGDATRCEVGELLRVGTTSLVLRWVEDLGAAAAAAVAPLPHPVQDLQTTSCDLSFTAKLSDASRSALDVQRWYFDVVGEHVRREGIDDEEHLVLDWWGFVLDALAAGRWERLYGAVDWATKRALLSRASERRECDLGDAHIRRLDFSYHQIGPDSLFQRLSDGGAVVKLSDDAAVTASMSAPPTTSRAAARADVVRRARAAGWEAWVDGWTTVQVRPPGSGTSNVGDLNVRLGDPLDPDAGAAGFAGAVERWQDRLTALAS